MNRRSFLQSLGLCAAGVTLSPMLDLAPIVAAPSALSAIVIPKRVIYASIRVSPELLFQSLSPRIEHGSMT